MDLIKLFGICKFKVQKQNFELNPPLAKFILMTLTFFLCFRILVVPILSYVLLCLHVVAALDFGLVRNGLLVGLARVSQQMLLFSVHVGEPGTLSALSDERAARNRSTLSSGPANGSGVTTPRRLLHLLGCMLAGMVSSRCHLWPI